MRLSDLLGYRVTDSTGTAVGGVADVRLVEDDGLRIDGLIVVERRTTKLFGYERQVGPAVLRRLVHAYLGEVWYLPWSEVDKISDDTVFLRSSRADLKRLEELARY